MFLDSDDFLELNACEIAYCASKEGYYDLVSFGSYSWRERGGGVEKSKPFIAYGYQSFQALSIFQNGIMGLKICIGIFLVD
ncbi:hypothetical protein [Helicobacter turcicus]|uniref:Glycosyltransferase 2-like domain-containing protein n=2 Tax=Helicobacter turcicus TaxID=2867412 RepID=A0ABS7JM13_9HELI|nr:hypothetical protein [Helicobacter turcicus]MBX7490430.1 hypothetical protein [Helicobacter turcicus]MBX7545289.1 hypothetical protein [Helicobacter turcicus]